MPNARKKKLNTANSKPIHVVMLKGVLKVSYHVNSVYGKKSFLTKESDTLRSYRAYISPTM